MTFKHYFASVALIGLLPTVEVGCKSGGGEPSLEDILEQHRAAVTAKVDHIRAIVTQIESMPPLSADGFSQVPDPLPDFRQLDLGSDRNAAPVHNARAIHLSLLQQGSEAAGYTRGGNDPGWWLSSVNALSSGVLESYQVKGLREIEKVDYLLVLRPRREAAPVVADEGTFVPGHFQGDALLFEVDGETYLGGIRVAAQNQPEIHFASGRAEQSAVDYDLGYQLNLAMSPLLQQHLPGMGPAFDTDGSPLTVYVGPSTN